MSVLKYFLRMNTSARYSSHQLGGGVVIIGAIALGWK